MLKEKLLKSKKGKDYLFCYGIIAWPFLVWAFFFVVNNGSAIIMAFQKIDAFGNTSFYPSNFREAFNLIFKTDNSLLLIGFKNSLKYFFWCNIFCLPITIIFSYLIWKKIPGYRLWRILMMIPQVVSGFVMMMVMKQFINRPLVSLVSNLGGVLEMPLRNERWTNTILIVYTCWANFGFGCLMYSNAMKEMDDSIVESYKIDGVSGMWQEIWHICLPGIFNTLSTFVITGMSAILMSGGPLLGFYMYNAPSYTYSVPYYFTLKTYQVPDYSGYPILTATGFMISAVLIPIVYLVRYLLYKYGPSED